MNILVTWLQVKFPRNQLETVRKYPGEGYVKLEQFKKGFSGVNEQAKAIFLIFRVC